jgi:hypothetical protein
MYFGSPDELESDAAARDDDDPAQPRKRESILSSPDQATNSPIQQCDPMPALGRILIYPVTHLPGKIDLVLSGSRSDLLRRPSKTSGSALSVRQRSEAGRRLGSVFEAAAHRLCSRSRGFGHKRHRCARHPKNRAP